MDVTDATQAKIAEEAGVRVHTIILVHSIRVCVNW